VKGPRKGWDGASGPWLCPVPPAIAAADAAASLHPPSADAVSVRATPGSLPPSPCSQEQPPAEPGTRLLHSLFEQPGNPGFWETLALAFSTFIILPRLGKKLGKKAVTGQILSKIKCL